MSQLTDCARLMSKGQNASHQRYECTVNKKSLQMVQLLPRGNIHAYVGNQRKLSVTASHTYRQFCVHGEAQNFRCSCRYLHWYRRSVVDCRKRRLTLCTTFDMLTGLLYLRDNPNILHYSSQSSSVSVVELDMTSIPAIWSQRDQKVVLGPRVLCVLLGYRSRLRTHECGDPQVSSR